MPPPECFESPYQGRTIIVWGASGFVGRWVSKMLAESGARLTFLVRSPEQSQRLFRRLGIRGEIRPIDLLDLRAVETAFRDLRPSITFNLAAYGVDRSERDPDLAYALNADLVRVLCLETASVEDDWAGLRLIHAGTALEYGTATGDLREDTPTNPTTSYGQSKLAGTRIIRDACCESGLKAAVARLFTVYGPGEHEGRLFPDLLEAASGKHTIPLTAGDQLRDFAYVEDIALGLMLLGAKPDASGKVINLATGKLLSVRDFVLQTAQVLRLDDRFLGFGQLPTREEEMAHNPVNINRLEALTGWRPPANVAVNVGRALARLDEGTGVDQHPDGRAPLDPETPG